jgi:hypothetical protein
MSTVMLGCAAVAVVAILTSLRYLPGRVDRIGSGDAPPQAPMPPAATGADAGTRR